MDKKTVWLVVGAVALIAAAPFVVKAATRRRDETPKKRSSVEAGSPEIQTKEQFERDRQQAEETPMPVLPGIGGIIAPLTRYVTSWNDYTVNTRTSNLNVREKPDSLSKLVGSLVKGSTVKAKASGVKGWMAVSTDGGKTTFGYSAMEYLKAKI
jgi:hypothetical protein